MRFFLVFMMLFSYSFASIGFIVLKKGDVDILRNSKNIKATNGSKIFEKDVISTLHNGKAQIKFNDATVITVGSNSKFSIDEYLNDSKKPKVKFNFAKGAFKTITGKIGKIAPENFKIKTKTATIGIRGTTFTILTNLRETMVASYLGVVTVKSNAFPQSPPTLLLEGKFTRLAVGFPPQPSTKLTPENITMISKALGEETPLPNGSDQGGDGVTPPLSEEVSPTTEGETQTPPLQPALNTDPITDELQDTIVEEVGASTSLLQPTLDNSASTNSAPVDAVDDAITDDLQDTIVEEIVEEVAEDLGVNPEEIQDGLQNQECPIGTTGTYPNCVAQTCPTGTIGVYPNCVIQTCPAGTTGTYPDCGTCGENQTGIYPSCIDLTCPAGTTGTYPDCIDLTCPTGTTGTYPDCRPVQSGGGTSTPTVTNSDRNTTLSGQVIQSFDKGGYFYGKNSNTSYSFIGNTLEGSNTLSFYDYEGVDLNRFQEINASSTFSFQERSISYNGYTSMGGFPISVGNPDRNISIGTGTSTLYSDSMQEFFVNYFKVSPTNQSDFNGTNSFTTIESFGKISNYSGIENSFSPIVTPLVAKYHAPYDSNENLWLHFGNKNFLSYKLPSENDGRFFILLGRVYSDSDDAALKGLVYEIQDDFSKGISSLSTGLTGNLYGSKYQGLNLGGIFTDKNSGSKNIGGIAAYRDPSSTISAAQASGTLNLSSGYAQARLDDNSHHPTTTANMTFYIDKGTGIISNAAGSQIDLSKNGSLSGAINYSDSGDPKTAYINDDNFATIATDGTEGWLSALDNFNSGSDDFVSWGWYSNLATHTILPSPWVAGSNSTDATAAIQNLPDTTLLKYTGKSMGVAYDGANTYSIDVNDPTNLVYLEFKKGEIYPITANSKLQFTINGTLWDIKPSHSNSSLSGGSYSTTSKNSDISSGGIYGSFYGPNAEGIGGSFNFATQQSNTTLLPAGTSIIGVFKGANTSTAIPSWFLALTGHATSSYEYVSAIEYSNTDIFSLVSASSTAFVGAIKIEDSRGSHVVDLNSSDAVINNNNDFGTPIMTADSNYNNDYVSWGYWDSTEVDSNATLIAGTNFWVAGKEAMAAEFYLQSLPANTHYTYTGKTLGKVVDTDGTHNIDPKNASNQVQLKFNVGAGSNSFFSDPTHSFIKFIANGKKWHLQPQISGETVSIGTISQTLEPGSEMDSNLLDVSGDVKVTFFGDQAQAVGGSFKASNTGNQAIGVFKAVK